MRGLLGITLALLLPATIGAQSFSYMKADSVTSSNLVLLQDPADFIKAARAQNATIFVTPDRFVFVQDAFLYVLSRKGYDTLEDLTAAAKAGYTEAALYYLARANNLKNPEEAAYFRSEYFATSEDYFRARDAGFVGKAAQAVVQGQAWLVPKDEAERLSATVQTLAAILASPGSAPLTVQPTVEGVVLVSWSGPSGWGQRRTGSRVALQQSDAVWYYTARLRGFTNWSEYDSWRQKQDTYSRWTPGLLDNLHYKDFARFLAGATAGFSDGRDFELASWFRVPTSAAFKPLESRLRILQRLSTQYGVASASYCLILEQLSALKPASTLSIDKFLSNANASFKTDPLAALVHPGAYTLVDLTDLADRAAKLDQLATLDFTNAVVSRN